MRRLLRLIARTLATVLLATVLSPAFAADTLAAAMEHDEVPAAQSGSGTASEHGDGEDCLHHHASAGHVFTHLLANLATPFWIGIADPAADESREPGIGPFALICDRLERPPLALPV